MEFVISQLEMANLDFQNAGTSKIHSNFFSTILQARNLYNAKNG